MFGVVSGEIFLPDAGKYRCLEPHLLLTQQQGGEVKLSNTIRVPSYPHRSSRGGFAYRRFKILIQIRFNCHILSWPHHNPRDIQLININAAAPVGLIISSASYDEKSLKSYLMYRTSLPQSHMCWTPLAVSWSSLFYDLCHGARQQREDQLKTPLTLV